jgi:hypothetical protein
MVLVKSTIEMPDALFRRAKAAAAERGTSLRELVTEAVSEKLDRDAGAGIRRPWEKAFGGLKSLRQENRRIEAIIDEEFERIEPDARP